MKLGEYRAPQATTSGEGTRAAAREPNALEGKSGERFGGGQQHCGRRANSSDTMGKMGTRVQEGSYVTGDGGGADGRGLDPLSTDDERASDLAPPPAVGGGHGSIDDVRVEGEDQQCERQVVTEHGKRAQCGSECVATCSSLPVCHFHDFLHESALTAVHSCFPVT